MQCSLSEFVKGKQIQRLPLDEWMEPEDETKNKKEKPFGIGHEAHQPSVMSHEA